MVLRPSVETAKEVFNCIATWSYSFIAIACEFPELLDGKQKVHEINTPALGQ